MGSAFRSDEEPFTLLGLKTGSSFPSRADVESAFRKRALRCHPDRHPKDPLAKTRFLRLSRAKEYLLAKAMGRPKFSNRPAQTSRGPQQERAGTSKMKAQQHQRSAEERARREAEERLKQREAEAACRQRRQQEAAAERGSRLAAARAEEQRQEELAAQERRKADIFEAWQRKKRKAQEAQASQQAQAATAQAESKEDRQAPPEAKAFDRRSPSSNDFRYARGPGSARNQKALLRLQKQRAGGEIPSSFHRSQGSWWVQDAQVDAYLRREELYGT